MAKRTVMGIVGPQQLKNRIQSLAIPLLLLCTLGAGLRPAVADEPPCPDADSTGPATGVRVLTTVQGEYGRLEVLEVRGLRILACDGVIQSATPIEGWSPSLDGLVQSRDFIGLIPYYRPAARRALVIGLGAGVHAQALMAQGMTVDSVDIEPAVVPLAEKYFGFRGAVTAADGREFLDTTAERYDAIVLDTFQGAEPPEHLYTKSAFQLMSERLSPQGVLVVHLISRPQHPATAAVARTLQAVFPHTVALRAGFGSELQHIYLLASREPLVLNSPERLKLDELGFTGKEVFDVAVDRAPLLTDNRPCLARLGRDLSEEHRRQSLKLLRNSR